MASNLKRLVESKQWDRVSKEPLCEKLMRKWCSYLNWTIVCEVQKLSIAFIIEMNRYVDWKVVCKNQRLDEGIIRQFIKYIDIDSVCQYQNLTETFMTKYAEVLNWKLISEYQLNLSEPFIRKFLDRLDIRTLCRTQHLSEELIEDVLSNKTKTDFEFLFKKVFSERMSEEVIDFEKEFLRLLKPEVVDKFIRNQDPLDWDAIWDNQILSQEFVDKYK